MSGAKLLPCAHCGIELYACTEGWSGGTRYAHEANSCILSRKFVQGPEQEEAWNRRAAVSVMGEPVAWIPQSRWERMTAAEPWLTNIVYSEDQSKFFSCVPLYAAPSAPDERLATLEHLLGEVLHCHNDGTGLLDSMDNKGGRYTSKHLADTIEAIRAALGEKL